MKLMSPVWKQSQKQKVFLPLALGFSVWLCGGGQGFAEPPPAWWSSGFPPPISGTAQPRAIANIGQAKYLAKCALDALRMYDPTTAAAIEADLVGNGKPIPSWVVPPVGSAERKANFAALNVGQLKAIAAPFYTHLHAVAPAWLAAERAANGTQDPASLTFIFPWTASSSDDANKSPASIGQMKAVFSLRFEKIGTSATDGNADWDGDGLTNAEEWLLGANPFLMDSDGDGIPDGSDPHPLTAEAQGQAVSSLVVWTRLED